MAWPSPSHGSFCGLSLCLYLACLNKSTEKARVKRQAFIFKIARVHSSLKKGVKQVYFVLLRTFTVLHMSTQLPANHTLRLLVVNVDQITVNIVL